MRLSMSFALAERRLRGVCGVSTVFEVVPSRELDRASQCKRLASLGGGELNKRMEGHLRMTISQSDQQHDSPPFALKEQEASVSARQSASRTTSEKSRAAARVAASRRARASATEGDTPKRVELHAGMEEQLAGAFGTSASFALRLGQTVFSSASLICIGAGFYGYSAFRYLASVMVVVLSWSIIQLMVDTYSVFVKCIPQQRKLIFFIFISDMVLSYQLLAAACSTASVTNLLLQVNKSYCPENLCTRYQLTTAMAFLAWFLLSASFLFNFWRFPSL